MKKPNLNIEPPTFVFMTEPEFIKHFGENFEESVIEHVKNDKPSIRIHNINGCISSIPIERAKYLLEKYYKMTGKSAAKAKKSQPRKQEEDSKASANETVKVERRNSSQSHEYA